MAKAPAKKDPVAVYNTTTRLISCTIPYPIPDSKVIRMRRVTYIPGNNSIPRADWEACLKNRVFKTHTKKAPIKNHAGKPEIRVALVEGRFDSAQAVEEAEFEDRLAEARKEMQASGN
jgi:hypothetical protein